MNTYFNLLFMSPQVYIPCYFWTNGLSKYTINKIFQSLLNMCLYDVCSLILTEPYTNQMYKSEITIHLAPIYLSYKWTGWVWELTGPNSTLKDHYQLIQNNLHNIPQFNKGKSKDVNTKPVGLGNTGISTN